MDLCHRRWWLVKPSGSVCLVSGACFRRRVRFGGHCERDGPRWRRHRSDHRTSQNATILDRIVSHVTVTDPRHALFGNQFAVLTARSGRGPAYVVVEVADGRRRSIRIASTDLAEGVVTPSPKVSDPPRISARTIIPLMQHLNASLTFLAEEVIRDVPSSPSRSRCVSTTADTDPPIRPVGWKPSASM